VKERRVIVGFDTAAPLNRAAAEAAAAIAGSIEGELAGLFVENVDLLHLAALPFTREVGFPSAETRELDVERMERVLRAVAGEANRLLGMVAARARLRWSFRVTRGVFAAELASAAERADLVLVPGRAGRVPGGAPRIRVISVRDRDALRAALEERRGPMLALTGDRNDAIEQALKDWL
jgi:hypothetical protein